MNIAVLPSEDYGRQETEELLAELRETGVDVQYGGVYGRRSIGEIPSALIFIAQTAAVGVVAGFLQQIGADAWTVLKKVVQRAAMTKHQGQTPQIVVRIEADGHAITLRGFREGGDINAQLDRALARLQEIGKPIDLWYAEESDTWLTLEETWAREIEKSRSTTEP